MNTITNSVQLIGRLGLAPEVKTLENGSKLMKIKLATTEYYKTKSGEKVEQTFWHTVIFWNKQADLAERLLFKGTEVAITGKLAYRQYEDKNNTKHYVAEVVTNSFKVFSHRQAVSA